MSSPAPAGPGVRETRAEYEPDDIPKSDASKAVERARRIVEVARRLLAR